MSDIVLKKSKYLKFVWLAMVLSGVVFIEPAPADIMIIFLFLIGIIMKLKFMPSSILPTLLLYLYLIGNLISFFQIEHFNIAIRFFLITLYLIIAWLFYIAIIRKYEERAIAIIFSGYTFAAVVSSVFAIMGYFHLFRFDEVFLKYGRATGLFKDPNVFGPYLVPIALYSILKLENSSKKKYWLLAFCICSIGIFLSFSRAAWGSYVLSLVVYFGAIFLSKPSLKSIFKGVAVSIVLSLTLMYILSIPKVESMYNIRTSTQQYDTERFYNQQLAIEQAIKNPFGVGPGHSEEVIDIATHNSYLRVWLENGFLGALGFILFLIATFFKSYRQFKNTKNKIYVICCASIAGILLNSMVVDSVHWRHFWLVLAIPWAVSINKTEVTPKNQPKKGKLQSSKFEDHRIKMKYFKG